MELEKEYFFALVDFEAGDKWSDHLEVWKKGLKLTNCAWIRYKAWKGEFPEEAELNIIQGIVIPGAAPSANNNWNEGYAFVKRIAERGKPQLYGGCFGAQLLAASLGGIVDSNPSKKLCFQSEQINLLSDWYKHPVLGCVGNRPNKPLEQDKVRLLESHGECVIQLPPGATLAASSKTTANEVWFIGSNILAMQAHPEFTPELLIKRVLPTFVKLGRLNEKEVLHAHSSFSKSLDSDIICDLIRQFLSFR